MRWLASRWLSGSSKGDQRLYCGWALLHVRNQEKALLRRKPNFRLATKSKGSDEEESEKGQKLAYPVSDWSLYNSHTTKKA